MRVAVTKRLVLKQAATGLHQLDEQLAALFDLLAADQRRVSKIATVTADRVDHRQSIVATDDEIVLTVRRRCVHRTGTGLERDVITQHHRHQLGQERVRQLQAFQRSARGASHFAHCSQAIARQAHIAQSFGQQQQFRALFTL